MRKGLWNCSGLFFFSGWTFALCCRATQTIFLLYGRCTLTALTYCCCYFLLKSRWYITCLISCTFPNLSLSPKLSLFVLCFAVAVAADAHASCAFYFGCVTLVFSFCFSFFLYVNRTGILSRLANCFYNPLFFFFFLYALAYLFVFVFVCLLFPLLTSFYPIIFV